MTTYCFWNNKGGTGKTSLAFQVTCEYARINPTKRVLVMDLCPQANLSELFLGGMVNNGSGKLLAIQKQGNTRRTIAGYFETRLSNPFSTSNIQADPFIVKPRDYNTQIPSNIDIVCGDPLLEMQSNAMATLSGLVMPSVNAWISVMSWVHDLIDALDGRYDTVFIDANPSFSAYTQMAIAASHELILPVMADDSSRRAVENVFSLVYGFQLPSDIYSQYAFPTKLKAGDFDLPKIRVVIRNRLTQYMGPASAYANVLSGITDNVVNLAKSHSDMFAVTDPESLFVDVRDFGTTGVVAFAKGCPFDQLPVGKISLLDGQRVQVKDDYRLLCLGDIVVIASLLP